MEEKDGKLSINAACKMCKLCVKKGPAGAVEYVEDEKKEEIDKSQWNGIAVYVDHVDGEIHPVTYELIGKARELASKINHPVYALFMGNNISDKAEELLHYGVDKGLCSRPSQESYSLLLILSSFLQLPLVPTVFRLLLLLSGSHMADVS